MKIEDIQITDPVYVKKERYNAFDRFFLKLIKDERDLPFVYLCMRILFISLPVAVVFYIPGLFSWWVAVPYIVLNTILNLGPFILMLHNTSHRKFFKKEYEWMNEIIPWVIGPLFGETPETYYGHHVGMHHPENNLSEDLSSTMSYQRDSFAGFMHYFLKFFFIGMYELTNYFMGKKRFEMMRNVLIGEFAFYAFCVGMSFINWQATLAVFIIPFVVARFGMMAGNWGQHAFVDATDPANSYKNSITCINSVYNKTCFNDGYHIGHHLRPAMHWTDLPGEFVKNKDKYAQSKAIVFEKLDFFVIWFLLMTKNYKAMSDKFVQLDSTYPSTEAEITAFLKVRTSRISDDIIEKFSNSNLSATARLGKVPRQELVTE
jgi:fatty acid desaturase